ncbi:shikimate dehydrogenase [Natribacillus halophilus]|uniref:Shikimate dehydrogenase (NADP(+)) n=1 Tax=Natribacillus halophilus TaxID=549003 RepID=A0A1G8JUZ9_9BACI|nr:shikimate dehydrogenase [Natribacillus halophilus]SDI34923.1 shikimate dehydrogenase [Natribacillus halophilus]
MENYAVIGHPIGHSKSPMIHNRHFDVVGREAIYTRYDVKPENLETAIAALQTLGVSGFNVTVPHKVNILPLLDAVDDEALVIGAVNTVVNRGGKWHGYNTDGQGYLNGLREMTGDALGDMSVLVIGAGGAARAVTTVLAKHGVKRLALSNRTPSRAFDLQANIARFREIDVIERSEAIRGLSAFDLIINTTSLGMREGDSLPMEIEEMKTDVYLSDLIYNPLETRWLQYGKPKARALQNGLPMFIEQAALAYEIWTDRRADRAFMSRMIREEMETNETNQ